MLRWETYITGSLSVVAVFVVLGWAAFRVRRAVLSTWSGPPARLAEIVIVVAIPIFVSEFLGSFGAFRRGPVLASCIGVGVVLGMAAPVAARRVVANLGPAPQEHGAPRKRSARSTPAELIAASLGTAAVAAQWASHVASALSRGMTHADTLWYHGPYAARFVQSGRLTGLLDRGDALHTYAGQNSELVHALLILPYGRDILSPFVNVGWAAVALLAAWCIGRRFGVPALSLLGVVVVLGLPIIVGTHPGQASNDVAAGALLLGAIALLLEGQMQPLPIGLAAIAAGLALGTKLTVAAPIALLTVGIVVVGLRTRRRGAVASWLALLAVSGSYWFIRNIAVAKRPIPWFGFHLGPISLPATAEIKGSTAVVHYIANSHIWTQFFLPGLAQGLGRAWPLVLALPLGGVFVVASHRHPLERWVGGAFLVGLIAYVFTPVTAAAGGLAFVFNLRYLSPTLLVGFAVGPLALDRLHTRWRSGASILLLTLIAVDMTAGNHERTPAWPQGRLSIAILAGAAVVAATVMLPKLRRMSLLRAAIAGLVIVAMSAAAGWWIQRNYLEHRYVAAGLPLDRINSYFRNVRNATVAVVGTIEIYPMFGLDLSNRVTPLTEHGGTNPCAQWHQILSTQYRYIVIAKFGFGTRALPPSDWFNTSAATAVVTDRNGIVYRMDGPLRPTAC